MFPAKTILLCTIPCVFWNGHAVRKDFSGKHSAKEEVSNQEEGEDKIKLYTFGCPKVSGKSLLSNGHKCIPGARVENENHLERGGESKDMVTWVGMWLRHTDTPTIRLFEKGSWEDKSCSWRRSKDKSLKKPRPVVWLHENFLYVNRTMVHGGEVGVVADIGLRVSYLHKGVVGNVTERGWGLVNSAVRAKEEVSHLIQNPETKECILTFEGTDRPSEWLYNARFFRTSWCGFGGVHKGFRTSLVNMLTDKQWQQKIRPNLGKCSKLMVTGHSLGGAMATLFAACAISERTNDGDYKKFNWKWETPSVMEFQTEDPE